MLHQPPTHWPTLTENGPAPERRGDTLFVVGGLVFTALGVAAGLIGALMVSFGTSSCDAAESTIAHQRSVLRFDLLLVAAAVAGVPAVWAIIARRTGRSAWFWATVSGLLGMIALSIALTAQPSTWCF